MPVDAAIMRWVELELWGSTEAMRALLEMIEGAAGDWNGDNPIRPLGP